MQSPGYNVVRPLGEDFEAQTPESGTASHSQSLCFWQENVGFNFQFFRDGTYRPGKARQIAC